MKLTSVLEKIAQQVWGEKDLSKSKQIITEFISETKIKDEDKKKILRVVKETTSKYKLDYYIANSLLTYEGSGLGQLERGEK